MKTSVASRFAGIATLALAALPLAALTTAAHAGERVRTGDLNLASPAGRVMFDQRVDHAAKRLCIVERNLTNKAACQAGVHAEANEKAAATTQFASRV
ncbi:MAG TPA: UrcA family protein [Phenylobacterium sp.]|jgi:UrcA family protein|uniref:UrcA family protein n=1 Tax=Phenylobacterium sp. TaxID=1871053 RepID=UPI002CFAE240|nr:UrcA family protein [Phenylobacterium sp.]HXA38102.1 UrcA family protein [Phenylobacterium sp.]